MSVRFQQPLINIRERLNHLFNHRHDAEYEKKGTYIGKNLLINGDKTVSQRGDFSTPFVPSSGNTYIDVYYPQFLSANVTIDYSHGVFDSEINSNTILMTVTASNNSSNSYVWHKNTGINFFDLILGKIVTYSALIKSNTSAVLCINQKCSSPHSGNGEYELLTISVKIPLTAILTNIYPTVAFGTLGAGETYVGEYIKIGPDKLELGNAFTGFDIMSYYDNMQGCRQFFLPLTTDDSYGILGTFVVTSTTEMLCEMYLTPMPEIAPTLVDLTVSGFTMLGTGTGTIINLLIDTTLTNMVMGKLVLKIQGIGFVVGETNLVQKNNDTGLIALV